MRNLWEGQGQTVDWWHWYAQTRNRDKSTSRLARTPLGSGKCYERNERSEDTIRWVHAFQRGKQSLFLTVPVICSRPTYFKTAYIRICHFFTQHPASTQIIRTSCSWMRNHLYRECSPSAPSKETKLSTVFVAAVGQFTTRQYTCRLPSIITYPSRRAADTCRFPTLE